MRVRWTDYHAAENLPEGTHRKPADVILLQLAPGQAMTGYLTVAGEFKNLRPLGPSL